ncbi:hypothetical protein FPOAC2_10727 [Fusarium poae]
MLDEANRMTESISAIPMSKCPKAYFLIVDDIRQFSPVITTMHRDDWKSFFGPQRQTSLFKRMEYSGAIQQRLESNYRARLDAADFIREKFYGGQMTIDYIADKTGSHNPNVVTDVPELIEVRVGTSFTNPATTKLAVCLAIQLYQEVTVISVKGAKAIQKGDSDIHPTR